MPASPNAVLAQFRGAETASLRSLFATWRATDSTIAEEEEIANLRRVCTPARGDHFLDLDVARSILRDPALYAQALAPSGTVPAAMDDIFAASEDEGDIIEDAPMSSVLRKLQREVFVLSLSKSIEAAPQLAGFETRLRDDGELEVEKGAGQDLNDLFAQLSEQDIHVDSLRNKANRLEELFMRLVEQKSTGGTPEDGA